MNNTRLTDAEKIANAAMTPHLWVPDGKGGHKLSSAISEPQYHDLYAGDESFGVWAGCAGCKSVDEWLAREFNITDDDA